MTVSFTLTVDDHTALVVYQLDHGPIGSRRWTGRLLRLVVLSLLAVCFVWQLALLINGGGWDEFLITVCGGLTGLACHLVFMGRFVKGTVRGQHARGELDRLLGARRLELRPHELVVTTDSGVSATAWSAVGKIATTADHAFFFHGEYGATVLPKHAFASDEEFTKFVEAARSCQEAARRSGADIPSPEAPAVAGLSRLHGGVVEVVFKLTPEDGLELFRHPSLRGSWGILFPSRWQRVVVAVVMLVVLSPLLWQLVVFAQGGGLGPVKLLWIVGGILLMALLAFLVFPTESRTLRGLKVQLSKQCYFTSATHRLRLTPDNLIHAVDSQVSATPWQAVEEIFTSAGHAFFRMGGKNALVLPRRAFAREEDFGDFVTTANQYRQAAPAS
jgi:hypothetical protein